MNLKGFLVCLFVCFVLCCFVLFCFVLFCFCFVWFGLVWFGLVWFGFVSFRFVLFCFVLFLFLDVKLIWTKQKKTSTAVVTRNYQLWSVDLCKGISHSSFLHH